MPDLEIDNKLKMLWLANGIRESLDLFYDNYNPNILTEEQEEIIHDISWKTNDLIKSILK